MCHILGSVYHSAAVETLVLVTVVTLNNVFCFILYTVCPSCNTAMLTHTYQSQAPQYVFMFGCVCQASVNEHDDDDDDDDDLCHLTWCAGEELCEQR